MKSINNCTLIGVEGVEKRIPQFLKAADICQHYLDFTNVKLLSPFNLERKEWERIKPMKDRETYCKFIINFITFISSSPTTLITTHSNNNKKLRTIISNWRLVKKNKLFSVYKLRKIV